MTDLAPTPRALVLRFDRAERLIHWLTAIDVLVLIATGLTLYLPILEEHVGRRLLVENVHTISGILALLPLLVTRFLPVGRALRRDLSRLGRLRAAEWRWFDRTRRIHIALDKFNPGQKLAAVLIGSGLTVLLGSGLILRFPGPFSLNIRVGATFVHDWFAAGVSALVLGHIVLALAHPRLCVSMVRGFVERSWAERHAPLWLDEMDLDEMDLDEMDLDEMDEEAGSAH